MDHRSISLALLKDSKLPEFIFNKTFLLLLNNASELGIKENLDAGDEE